MNQVYKGWIILNNVYNWHFCLPAKAESGSAEEQVRKEERRFTKLTGEAQPEKKLVYGEFYPSQRKGYAFAF